MKRNMGATDKTIRLIVALIIAVLFFTNQISGTTAIILGIVGLIFTLTSMINFCPLYTLIGVNTCKKK